MLPGGCNFRFAVIRSEPTGTIAYHGLNSTTAATVLQLRWRTFLRAVGAEHTTISVLGPHQRVAMNARMEETAGVGGHFFQRRPTTLRAGQH